MVWNIGHTVTHQLPQCQCGDTGPWGGEQHLIGHVYHSITLLSSTLPHADVQEFQDPVKVLIINKYNVISISRGWAFCEEDFQKI